MQNQSSNKIQIQMLFKSVTACIYSRCAVLRKYPVIIHQSFMLEYRENDNAWRTSNLEVNIWLGRKKFHLPHPLIVAGLYQNVSYHMHTFSNLNEDTPEMFIGFSLIES